MLREEIRNIKSDPVDVRNFVWVIGIAVALFGAYRMWSTGAVPRVVFSISAVLIGTAFVDTVFGSRITVAFKPAQRVWMVVAVAIGFVMSRIILSLLFYGMFTFIHVVSRVIGSELLPLKPDADADSYWIRRDAKPYDPERSEKQY